MKKTIILLLVLLVGCSKSIPVGDTFIADVTYILISEYDGVEERFEYSTIWDTQLDCIGRKTIESLPQPKFNEKNIHLNSTLTYFIGFQPLQYVDCGDFIFKGFENVSDSYYIE